MDHLVVLTGPVSVGKTTLARGLSEEFGASVFSTKELLLEGLDGVARRGDLQSEGDRLDRQTMGRWVVDALLRRVSELDELELVVVDSARILSQIEAFRDAFGTRVVHVHLCADLSVLAERYEARRAQRSVQEPESYEEVRRNETERRVDDLAREADVVVDTDPSVPNQVLIRVAGSLGLLRGHGEKLVDVLVGGQYGSEGKGNIASFLAPEYGLLVRSGGANAGHSVWTPGGRHVAHHLPSGAIRCEAPLLLTAGSVIYPPKLLEEIAASGVDQERLAIDPQAMVVTDEHKAQEADLEKDIASTGSGVGAATADRIVSRGKPVRLASDVPELRPYIRSGAEVLRATFREGRRVLVEGTQGTGLSILHGTYPYVTSRDTTVSGLLSEAGIPPSRVRRVVMVVRTHPIRVQNPGGRATSGPLYREITWREVADRSGLDIDGLEAQERTSTTGRERRVGEFDWELLRESAELNGPSDLAVTFLDQLDEANVRARRFEQLTESTIRFIEEVELVAGAPVSLASVGFHQRAVIDRRVW